MSSHLPKCTVKLKLPQTSANNLEMHKLFIKAAYQNIFLPPSWDFCAALVSLAWPDLGALRTAVEVERSREGTMNPDSTGLTALPLLALENKLSEKPFHNTEPTINTDLCRILFHCFQNTCGLVESEPK